MEVLQIFGLCDRETDLWFTTHEPSIPTLKVYNLIKKIVVQC